MPKTIFNSIKFQWLALAAIPAMVACGGPSVEDTEAALCDNLNELATALQGLGQLSADSTVDDLESARADVASAYEAVQSSAADVQAARLDGLETAYANYESTVDSISGRDTLGEAAVTVANASEEVASARQQLYADLTCQ